jgi:tetratricopeptide (TPR) repeat protein
MATCRSVGPALLASAVLLGLSLAATPVRADASPEPNLPPKPQTSSPSSTSAPKATKPKQRTRSKKKQQKRSEQQFLDGYRAAHALVQAGRYEQALAAFKALRQDDHADVANYIGFVSRKLGRYDDAKVWYERALAADPTHVRTWQYYGMWHVEQGNMLKAKDHLDRIRSLCGGETCKEFADLKGAMEGTVVY